MKVQHSGEDGGTVRGVCGAEERTPIAYIPIGIGGCSGLLRAQIVPGPVPCLIPAYLLTDMGSVIDMVGLTLFHTTLGVTQQMHRRSTGHVEVSITEYGRGFSMPEAASFGRSQVWSDQLLPTPIRIANAFDMRVPLEALLLALAIGGVDSGRQCLDDRGSTASTSRRPSPGRQTRAFGTAGSGHAAEGGRAHGSISAHVFGQGANAEHEHHRRDGSAATPGTAPWTEPIPGAGVAAIANLHAYYDKPRLQPRLELDQVRRLWGYRADTQADPRPDDRVEHCLGVSEALLCDTPAKEGGQASQESRDNYRDELDNADCRTTTDDDHAIGAYDPDVDGHSGTTESYPNIWRQPAADSVFGTIDGKNNSGGYRTFERPTLGRADAPNRGDGATATSPTARPRCESEFEIGTPDSQAIPPPTLAGDWEHDKEMMEDALNLLMPGAAPTRSCTKCLVGELVLNWREGKQKYLWICQRGGPSCEFVWTDWIELNSVMAAFEVKLCFQCQAEALKPHQLRDRWAWKCPSCHDQTLMSESNGVMASFLRSGGYNPDRTHQWMALGSQ